MRAEPKTVTDGPTKCRVRNPRKKSRITRKRVKNSAKRERGPSRKISSSGSEGAVGGELAGGSVTERSLSSTTLTSVLSLAKGEADHATMHMDGHCKRPYGSQRR